MLLGVGWLPGSPRRDEFGNAAEPVRDVGVVRRVGDGEAPRSERPRVRDQTRSTGLDGQSGGIARLEGDVGHRLVVAAQDHGVPIDVDMACGPLARPSG
jgi:hypothetical protein